MTAMKYKRFLLSALCAVLLSGCGVREVETPVPVTVQTFQNVSLDAGFDTVMTLTEQTDDAEGFYAHFETMCESFRRYNALFDIYNDYEGIHNLKTINDMAGIEPVEVDPELIELLVSAKEMYELSDGAFDITIGSLLQVWHNYRTIGIARNEAGQYGELPPEEELEEAASHRGFEHVIIDEENHTVYIDDPDISLDVGGIAKGFAAEYTACTLEALGVDHAAINAGGNNRTLGSKVDGSTWNVGIQNPDGAGSLFVVRVEGTNSFVTSGDYERFYLAEGDLRLHHIIDPQTWYPSSRYRSVTVVTKNSADADCLSTALFLLPYAEGVALLERYSDVSGNPADAVWIAMDGSAFSGDNLHEQGEYVMAYTDGLKDRIVWGK